MTVYHGRKQIFEDLGFEIATSIYTNAGDNITCKLKRNGLSADTYARKHYVVRGEFKSEFPNSGELGQGSGVVGTMWPLENYVNTDTFQIIAVKDNSSYICFVPTEDNKKIVHTSYTLQSNIPFVAEQGCAYIPSVDCETADGEIKKAFSVIVCQNSSTNLILKEYGTIVKFQSIVGESNNLVNA